MIQTYTRLKVADNTGARQIMCINIPGKKKKKKRGFCKKRRSGKSGDCAVKE